jgi:exosortase
MVALWAQVFYTASYGWLYGEYYDYGWYVPPLAIWFFYRKWSGWEIVARPPLPRWVVAGGMVCLTLALAVIRTFGRADAAWSLPMWSQAAIACVLTGFVVRRMAGKSALAGLVPVLLFALTAIRLPTEVETILVNGMTHGVLGASSWVFNLFGRPVTILGNQLELMGQVVEVTEGCSGIRSAQSFLMASLCFGEWLGLSARSRVLMVATGFLTAWVMNVARACTLAEIRFNQGESAFEKAHDPVGVAAFVVGTGILLWVSVVMDSKRRSGQVVRKTVAATSV